MKLVPLSDKILIKPEPPQATVGGIVIPTTLQKKPQMATVLSVGPGHEHHKMTVKENDRVMFPLHAGTELEVEGETVILIKENELLAIIK